IRTIWSSAPPPRRCSWAPRAWRPDAVSSLQLIGDPDTRPPGGDAAFVGPAGPNDRCQMRLLRRRHRPNADIIAHARQTADAGTSSRPALLRGAGGNLRLRGGSARRRALELRCSHAIASVVLAAVERSVSGFEHALR